MVIVGNFDLTNSENFEEYMKAIGVGVINRKIGATLKPRIEITQAGDTYSLKTVSSVKTTEIKFKLGEEFDETTLDGNASKSCVTLEGADTLVHKQSTGGKSIVMTRKFHANGMDMTLEGGGVTAKRTYKRV